MLVEAIEASASPATKLSFAPKFPQTANASHVFVPESDCDATEDAIDLSSAVTTFWLSPILLQKLDRYTHCFEPLIGRCYLLWLKFR